MNRLVRAHKECDFVIPILKVIAKYPDGCTISQAVGEIPNHISLNEMDKKSSPSRKGEVKYQQIIRNLISHKNKTFFDCVDTVCNKSKRSIYVLNANGYKLLGFTNEQCCAVLKDVDVEKLVPVATYTTTSVPPIYSNNQDLCELLNLDKYDMQLLKQINSPDFKGTYKTNKSIGEYVKCLHEHQCLYTRLTGSPKITILTPNGVDFVHSHHLIPMSAQKFYSPKSLDRPSNIVPLAPYYHDVLHHGIIEVKKEILFVLYNATIKGLNHDGIYISFEQLLELY